jgi:two-component system response regulator HydG
MILIADDQMEMSRTLADGLSDGGFVTVPTGSGKRAIELLREEPFDAVITDLRMPDVDGLAVLEASRRLDPDRPVIMMTAFSAIETAVESIRRGAYHYLTKPFKTDELILFLRRALDERAVRREAKALRSALRERFSIESVFGKSESTREIAEIIARVADTDMPVLILGETGTGKGLVARALHTESRRASGPFVTVNCSALPEPLLESELFGHVEGAFTGATSDRVGLFVEADAGTLFLDEIGDMSLSLQAKLLHAIESGRVRPLGSSKERAIDVRIVSATHRDLRKGVREGLFREDLLYRLDAVSIEVPPLRHRKDDLPRLIAAFLERARQRHPTSPVERISRAALEALLASAWPGNVRELEHCIERAVVLGKGREVEVADLPATVTRSEPKGIGFLGEVIPAREMQRAYAAWALEKLGGNKSRAAERLGIDAKTLARWLADES